MLGGEAGFDPKHKDKRWAAFFSSGSRYGEELRGEIIRMKELFERSSVDAGLDGTEEHGVFDAELEAIGILAKGPQAPESRVRRHQDSEDEGHHEAGRGAASRRREEVAHSPVSAVHNRKHTCQHE